MSERDLGTTVRTFYEEVRFPGVRPADRDGLVLMRHLARRSAELSGRRLRILDAGCGTGNTLASLARALPEAELVGVDFSEPSLELAREATAELSNLTLARADLMKPLEHGRFDVVLCLGVLHHVADMPTALGHLREALADEGSLYLWMYGRHGRYRHGVNLRLLRLLLDVAPPGTDPVSFARDFALNLEGGAPLEDLFGHPPDGSWKRQVLENDAWVADQFLHPHELVVDMAELLELAGSIDLELVEWLGVSKGLGASEVSPAVKACFERLAPREALLAADALRKPDSYLVELRGAG